MAYKVFFSHSNADREWAKWIAKSAGGAGIEVYLYEHDPRPGVQIATKVKQAIVDANSMVVLLTPNSSRSPYVQQEIGYAEANHKLIIPLVCNQAQKPNLAMLEGREYVEFDQTNPGVALGILRQYLQQKLKEQQAAIGTLLGLGSLIAAAFLFGSRK